MSLTTYMRADRGAHFVTGLQDLIAELPAPIRVVEIGVFAGEASRLFLGSGKVRELVAVDPWAGDYDEGGVTPWRCPWPWAEVRQTFAAWAAAQPNVITFPLPSVDAARCFPDHYFDVAYIDANHSYAAVRADIAAWRAKIQPLGYLAGHDYSVAFPGTVKAVHEACRTVRVFPDTSWLCAIGQLR